MLGKIVAWSRIFYVFSLAFSSDYFFLISDASICDQRFRAEASSLLLLGSLVTACYYHLLVLGGIKLLY